MQQIECAKRFSQWGLPEMEPYFDGEINPKAPDLPPAVKDFFESWEKVSNERSRIFSLPCWENIEGAELLPMGLEIESLLNEYRETNKKLIRAIFATGLSHDFSKRRSRRGIKQDSSKNMELWKSTQEGFTKECNQLSEVYDGIVELLTIQKGLS